MGILFEHHPSDVEEQYCSQAEYCHQTNPTHDTATHSPKYANRPKVFKRLCSLHRIKVFNPSHAKNPIHKSPLLRIVPASDHRIAGSTRYSLWKSAIPENDKNANKASVYPDSRKTPAGVNECRIHVVIASGRFKGNNRRVR